MGYVKEIQSMKREEERKRENVKGRDRLKY